MIILFETYIVGVISSDKEQALVNATQGTVTIHGESGPNFTLYAPTTWNSQMSLRFFVPNNNTKIARLLDWNAGMGTVMRDLSELNTYHFFSNLLGWNLNVAVGMNQDTPVMESFATTGEPIGYQEDISFSVFGNNYSCFPIINSIDNQYNIQTHCSPNTLTDLSDDIDDYLCRLHPNYSLDGSTDNYGTRLSLLMNSGEWDVIYENQVDVLFRELGVFEANYSQITKHYPDSAYARTYDGMLRMRLTAHDYFADNPYIAQTKSWYYVVKDIPQAVEMNPQMCRFLPEFDDYYDEYTGVIRVPIGKTEGTTQIIVAQYDDGDNVPFYYGVPNVKDNFFTAIVDKEFQTRFVLYAYNENGYTQSEYIYDPLMAAGNVNLDFVRTPENILIVANSMRNPRRNTIMNAKISYVMSNLPMDIRPSVNNNVIDISTLRHGSYVLTVTDLLGAQHSYKFIK